MLTTISWEDVIARVRGLASRNLGRGALERLAMSRDLATFVDALRPTVYASVSDLGPQRPVLLERETRRVAGERLTILAAWCGDRAATLAPLFEDEDRRNLRSLARSIAAHAPAERAAAGLLPTPALPSAALDELAAKERLRDLAATLVTWGNPYGAAMMPEAMRDTPDLFALHLAVDREYAKRALPVAKQAGEPMIGYVHLVVDAENARTALAVADGAVERDPSALFVEGGELVTLEIFETLATGEPADARARLARLFGGTVLAPVVNAPGGESEGAVLTAMLRHFRRAVRVNPLSLYVVLDYVLELRAELEDLARIIWGIALQMPRRRIIGKLVTP